MDRATEVYKLAKQNNTPAYPASNSGHHDSLEKGEEFQDFVCIELGKIGIIIQNMCSKKYQYSEGENRQGIEIKYDARCTGDNNTIPTNRLSIEIAEKTNASNSNYVPSGIYRNDNSWLYIQGNYNGFWIFSKRDLQQLHRDNNYPEMEQKTIKTFFIPIEDADNYCLKKFTFK